MHKMMTAAIASIALFASGTALAQSGRPPISPERFGGGSGHSDLSTIMATDSGHLRRNVAAQQRLAAEQRRIEVEAYRASAQQRRIDALAMAENARRGALLSDADARRIRGALKDDMEAWRDAFRVRRDDWQAMRHQWLVDRAALTPAQWATQRAQWFVARDRWILAQRGWAGTGR
jgi:hypothetical protein